MDGLELPELLLFLQLFWALDHALQSRSKMMQKTLGISGPQRLVLRVLGQKPGASAGEVAAALHLHPSTLTGILRRLEARRLIKSHRDSRDRRQVRLVLTAAGRRINLRRRGTVESAVEPVLAGLSSRDRSVVRRVLKEMTAAIADASPVPAPARKSALTRG